MNFEFLKDLRGLNYVYENCSNAEKLAMTMFKAFFQRGKVQSH